MWQCFAPMRTRLNFILSWCLIFCIEAPAAQILDQAKEASECTTLLADASSAKASVTAESSIKIIKLSSKPRFFSPEKSHLDLKVEVGSKSRVHYSRIIQTDHDPKDPTHQKTETTKLMNLTLQYSEHIQNPGIFSRELENFGRLNAILLSPIEFEIQEESSNSLLQIRSELLDLDLKIQQKHNQASSRGDQEFDPESLGELLSHLTQSKERLLYALKNLTDVQIRYRLLEIQSALNENTELLQADFAKELAELLKEDPESLMKVLLDESYRALIPWTIALQHPEDRLITALIYEILANRPQELEFIKIFSAPEPEDED